MSNGRCRMHGGASTGPRTPEGLEKSRRARWKHGFYSAEAKAERRAFRGLLKTSGDLLKGGRYAHKLSRYPFALRGARGAWGSSQGFGFSFPHRSSARERYTYRKVPECLVIR